VKCTAVVEYAAITGLWSGHVPNGPATSCQGATEQQVRDQLLLNARVALEVFSPKAFEGNQVKLVEIEI
jgi:hypothetical protein